MAAGEVSSDQPSRYSSVAGGMSPMISRVDGFQMIVGGSWAELATRFGWFDQAHLANDVKRMLGVPPSQARELLAGPPGLDSSRPDAGAAA
jgi:hypothetical protein